mmetsp:Transcript_9440/g.8972  ORF Transcript_9440/g.8972 Transcript_9440/m.8972 type:complete len:254 (+) Transcript_9440:2696-3457(+)
MAAPTLLSNTDTEITVQWTPLTSTDTGNSAITAYNLYWDNAGGTVNIHLVEDDVTQYTVTGITTGSTYLFGVRAYNLYGYGAFSADLSVTPTYLPDQVATATVTKSGTDVIIDWTAPANHGSNIVAYSIEFLTSTDTYALELTGCDGTDTGSIVPNTQCTSAMTDLVTATNFPADTLIQVRIKAQNSVGWGDYSQLNILGDTIEDVPAKMTAPSYDASLSDNDEIYLTWTAPTDSVDIGGSALSITGYEVYWN